jgi:hypothetical protein
MEIVMEAPTQTASAPNKAKTNATNVPRPHWPSICPGAHSGMKKRNIGNEVRKRHVKTTNGASKQ